MNAQDPHRYDDIIDLPHHVSAKHPPLSMKSRAAQFSPFAALPGYGDVIQEAARSVERRVELSEDEENDIGARLRDIAEHRPDQRLWSVIYYRADSAKDGGSYLRARGRVRRIRPDIGRLIMENGTEIRFEDIMAIDEA